MKILPLLADFAIIALSWIVPKNKKLYVFGGGDGTSFKGNPKYIFIHIFLNRKDLKPVWITESDRVFQSISEAGIPVLKKNSLRTMVTLIRARYLFIEITPKDVMYSGYTAAGRLKYIQTFHGMPLKKIGHDAIVEIKGISRINTFRFNWLNTFVSKLKISLKKKSLYQKYDLIVSSSRECTERYYTAFDNRSVAMLGFARNDVLMSDELNFFKNMHLPSIIKKRRVISYVPTFRDVPSDKIPFTDEQWVKLNNLLQKTKSVMLLKKHPYEKNLEAPGGLNNIIDVSSQVEDVMDLLLVTDILVTDYSSVFFDFIVTGKPVIYYSYDSEEYIESCRGMYYDYYTDISGPFAKNFNEFHKLLDTVDKWFGSKQYKKRYDEFVSRFNAFRDSGSSERLLKYLEEKRI